MVVVDLAKGAHVHTDFKYLSCPGPYYLHRLPRGPADHKAWCSTNRSLGPFRGCPVGIIGSAKATAISIWPPIQGSQNPLWGLRSHNSECSQYNKEMVFRTLRPGANRTKDSSDDGRSPSSIGEEERVQPIPRTATARVLACERQCGDAACCGGQMPSLGL